MDKKSIYTTAAATAVIAGAVSSGVLFPVMGVVIGAGYVLAAFSLTLGVSSVPIMAVGGLAGAAIGAYAGRAAFSPFGRFAASCLEKLGFRKWRKETPPEKCTGFFRHAKEFTLDAQAIVNNFNSAAITSSQSDSAPTSSFILKV